MGDVKQSESSSATRGADVCSVNTAGLNNYIQVIFCLFHPSISAWTLVSNSSFVNGRTQNPQKRPPIWASPIQALWMEDEWTQVPSFRFSQVPCELRAALWWWWGRWGWWGCRGQVYSKASRRSVFFPSFFQVIHSDACPGCTKSVRVELNS